MILLYNSYCKDCDISNIYLQNEVQMLHGGCTVSLEKKLCNGIEYVKFVVYGILRCC